MLDAVSEHWEHAGLAALIGLPGLAHTWLADPNTARTNLGSNALWQVALLEMWLQERGI